MGWKDTKEAIALRRKWRLVEVECMGDPKAKRAAKEAWHLENLEARKKYRNEEARKRMKAWRANNPDKARDHRRLQMARTRARKAGGN